MMAAFRWQPSPWLDLQDNWDRFLRWLGSSRSDINTERLDPPDRSEYSEADYRVVWNEWADAVRAETAAELERLRSIRRQNMTGKSTDEIDDPISVVTMDFNGQRCTWDNIKGLTDELETWWDEGEDTEITITFGVMSEAAFNALPEFIGWMCNTKSIRQWNTLLPAHRARRSLASARVVLGHMKKCRRRANDRRT